MKRATIFISRLRHWILRLILWIIWEVKDVWITLLVVILITGSALLICSPVERGIRISGLLLELLGIGVVAKGLSESRVLFGRPTLPQAAQDWIKRFPKFGRQTHVLLAANANVQMQASSATLSVGSVTVHTSTLEARVSLLEEKLKLADKQINDVRFKQEEESKNRIAAINSEATAREVGDTAVLKQLEEAVVGGIMLETMGIVWLAFGVILSSLSEEWASLVARLI